MAGTIPVDPRSQPETGARPDLINGALRLDHTTTAYNPSDPRAPAGVYTITATFTNTSRDTFTDLFFQATALTDGFVVLNRAPGSPAGVGAVIRGAALALGSDGRLSPGERFTQAFVIGLPRRERFTFFVDAYGVPMASTQAALVAAAAGYGRAHPSGGSPSPGPPRQTAGADRQQSVRASERPCAVTARCRVDNEQAGRQRQRE